MAERCGECGAFVDVGETRCRTCDAMIPGAVDAARAPGLEVGSPPGPPPEGLDLIMQKHWADRESYTRSRQDDFYEDPDYRTASEKADSALDNLSDLMRPERDAAGQVKVDMRYAIVGLVVILLVLAALGAYVFLVINDAKSSLPTVTTFGR